MHNSLAYLLVIANIAILAKTLSTLACTNADYNISSVRWIIALAVPTALALHGLRRKSVNLSGAIAGALVGHSILLSNYCLGITLVVCFFATSYSTRYKQKMKSGYESEIDHGSGGRTWVQVISNVGFPSLMILLRLELFSSGELLIDFEPTAAASYWASWLLTAALGGMSAALGDTLSSELGPLSSEEPILITNPAKVVPKGTNGGVTIAGLLAAALGGALIGVSAFLAQFAFLGVATSQWPIILFCAYAGLIGSVIDSVLGATLQYSGYDHLKKRIVGDANSTTSNYVEHISGLGVLNNHEVNLISVATTSLLVAFLGSILWPSGHIIPVL